MLTGNPKSNKDMEIPWETLLIQTLLKGEVKMIGIYKITDKTNQNMFYIGQSNDIERRFKEHQQKTYEQSRIPFDKYIKEKGKENFFYEILEECSLEQLNEKEKYWIKYYNATESGNQTEGGFTDVIGSHNPKSKLTEEDVVQIRIAYKEHKKQKDIYENFKDKISFGYFQNLWQGRSWSHIMPEVFTKENKEYYIYQNSKGDKGAGAKFTDEEVIQIRNRYVNESAKDIYKDYKDRVSFQTLQQILWGRYYSHLPIYKKKEKIWINNEPVSTIP